MQRLGEWVLYYLGAAGAVCWLAAMAGWLAVAVVAAVVTGVAIVAAPGRPRALRAAGLVALSLFQALSLYLAIAFGWLLGWTVTWPVRCALLAIAVVALISSWRRLAHWRIPTIFPLGLWIGVCLLGWARYDGVIRCDDYARFERQRDLRLVVRTTQELDACTPGKLLRLGRYPRRVWESPDGRYLVTTQSASHPLAKASPVSDPITGGVCEFHPDGSRGPCLVDKGKLQVILDAPKLDRVFIAGWDAPGGGLYALSRNAPLRLLGEVQTEQTVADGYYDADMDEIGLIDDQAVQLTRFRASDLSPLPPAPGRVSPGETHYAQATHEGLFCFAAGPIGPLLLDGKPFLSVAFRGDPFALRAIGTSPWAYAAAVWGCDFDPARRIAWTLVANLGVIAAVDYDSGRVGDVWWTEPGLRSAVFDAARRRLYVANFLRGDVSSVDIETGRRAERWFAGRFVRYVGLSRDRSALLVTSNLGVVRIPLPPVTAANQSVSQVP